MKTCNHCTQTLPLSNFYSSSVLKDGHENICKSCKKSQYKERYKKDETYQQYKKSLTNAYKSNHIDAERIRNQEWYLANRARHRQNKNNYTAAHRDDPLYQLRLSLRFRLRQQIRRCKLSTISSTQHITELGCSIPDLKSYLESKFLPGMTWDNHGLYGWHIDHVQPLSAFDLNDPEQLKKACHFSNLQPLWATDNLKKHAKY